MTDLYLDDHVKKGGGIVEKRRFPHFPHPFYKKLGLRIIAIMLTKIYKNKHITK